MMKFRCGQSFAAFGTSEGCPSFGSGVGSGVSPLCTQMLKKPGRGLQHLPVLRDELVGRVCDRLVVELPALHLAQWVRVELRGPVDVVALPGIGPIFLDR